MTAAAQHHVIGRLVVRRVVIEVMQLQRAGRAAVRTPAALHRRELRATLLVALAADAPQVSRPRHTRRAVGPAVDQLATAEAAALHAYI